MSLKLTLFCDLSHIEPHYLEIKNLSTPSFDHKLV